MERLLEPGLIANETAVLVVDMQYGDAHREHGLLRSRREAGRAAEIEYYADRLETLVVPNLQRLLPACRAAGIEVLYTVIASLTRDGRDRGLGHKRLGIHFPPGSREAQVLDDVAPAGDEIVLPKTCSSVFNGTQIEYVLRNIGIRELLVCGVVTGSCVEAAVRDAADRGFSVMLVEDATATWSPEMQTAALKVMAERYAKVRSAQQVIERLESNGS
ncbi:MAG: cysteine hydrolase family protein [Chloroflexota bacterium]